MKAEITYEFSCKDGFTFNRNTLKDIIDKFNETVEALERDQKKGRISKLCRACIITHDYIVDGFVVFRVDGKLMKYELKTIIREI